MMRLRSELEDEEKWRIKRMLGSIESWRMRRESWRTRSSENEESWRMRRGGE